jgi:hypothetical protein
MCCGHQIQVCGCGCGHHPAGSCTCGQPSQFGRRFHTKEEMIVWLEGYLKDLRQEAKAVEVRIADMKG